MSLVHSKGKCTPGAAFQASQLRNVSKSLLLTAVSIILVSDPDNIPNALSHMNAMTKTALSATLLLTLSACGDSSEGGQTAPIDSTNAAGIAPAQYSEGTPENRVDTTIYQHDANMKDTLSGGREQRTLPQNRPQGNGSNTSNTTDARTTTGSANQGDADKDHKR